MHRLSMMRSWIAGIVLALGVAGSGCGSSKATCEKLLKRGVECTKDMAGQSAAMKSMAAGMIDDMTDKLCSEDEVAGEAGKLASCLDKDSCDAFNQCIEDADHGASLPGL